MRVSLTWAVDLGTSVTGKKDCTLGGKEDTVQWVWQEVCTVRPLPVKREYTPFKENAGNEGEQRITISAVFVTFA